MLSWKSRHRTVGIERALWSAPLMAADDERCVSGLRSTPFLLAAAGLSFGAALLAQTVEWRAPARRVIGKP